VEGNDYLWEWRRVRTRHLSLPSTFVATPFFFVDIKRSNHRLAFSLILFHVSVRYSKMPAMCQLYRRQISYCAAMFLKMLRWSSWFKLRIGAWPNVLVPSAFVPCKPVRRIHGGDAAVRRECEEGSKTGIVGRGVSEKLEQPPASQH
jgi:hypothetical protein